MMRIILILILTTAFNYSYAILNTSDCKEFSLTAESIMSARQNGVPMYKMIEIYDDVNLARLRGLMDVIIEQAYETNRYNSKSFKQKAIEDFKDDIFLSCYKLIDKP
jgi:hypothetical protein